MSNQDKKESTFSTSARYVDRDAFSHEGESGREQSRKERMLEAFQTYCENSKAMLSSSANHMRSPITLIVMIFLIALYILLGWAGSVGFSFFNGDIVQQITTNLDIIVNALLGYFFGPVTCAIGVALCTIVRMIVNLQRFYAIYFICATVAGFLHGWILYRHKPMWFGTRFRGFFTDMLAKIVATRLAVSTFVNVLLMGFLYKVMYQIPIADYISHYAKSGVELESFSQFLLVFFISLGFEILIVFAALAVITFIESKAFPSQHDDVGLIVNESGDIFRSDEH